MRKSVIGGLAEKRIFGRSLLAFTLAATLAFPATTLSFVVQAFADDPSSGDAAEAPAAPVAPADEPIQRGDVHGIDFMTPTAEDGLWDLLRVENGAGKNIYFEIEKDGVIVAPRFAYQIPNEADVDTSDADYAGDATSARIAQVVALKLAVAGQAALGQMSEEADAPALSLQQVYADPNNFPTYTIKVFDAKRQGEKLYQGTVCPIYAQLVSTDGTDEWKVLGIRTIDPDNDKFAETVGAGTSYYKNLTGDTPIVFQSTATTEAGEPKAEVQDVASGSASSSPTTELKPTPSPALSSTSMSMATSSIRKSWKTSARAKRLLSRSLSSRRPLTRPARRPRIIIASSSASLAPLSC